MYQVEVTDEVETTVSYFHSYIEAAEFCSKYISPYYTVTMKKLSSKLESKEAIRYYIEAGNSTFTIYNSETDNRFTYFVRKPQGKNIHFVNVLTGPENTSSYSWLGTLFVEDITTFKYSNKSPISKSTQSALAFEWLIKRLMSHKEFPPQFEFWTSGRCGRCGRLLTTVDSIASGFGPKCIKKVYKQDQLKITSYVDGDETLFSVEKVSPLEKATARVEAAYNKLADKETARELQLALNTEAIEARKVLDNRMSSLTNTVTSKKADELIASYEDEDEIDEEEFFSSFVSLPIKLNTSCLPDSFYKVEVEGDNACPENLSPEGINAWTIIYSFMNSHSLTNTGGCKTFYSPKEWAQRGWDVGEDSVLEVVYDGGDVGTIFNYLVSVPKLFEKVHALLEAAGFCIELHNCWSMSVVKF